MKKPLEYLNLILEADEQRLFWTSYEAEEELERINKEGKTGVIWRERDIFRVLIFNKNV